MSSSRISAVLIAGDVVSFLVFALAGLRSHDSGPGLTNLARAGLPFLVAWLPIAFALGLMRPGIANPVWPRVLTAWAPAWAIGLLLRSLIFGRPFAPTFAVVSFLVNAALLVGWRTAYAYFTSRSAAAAGRRT